MNPRALLVTFLVLAPGITARSAFELCCNGKDDDGDGRIDTKDTDCADSVCTCTRPDPELFFGTSGPGEFPRSGVFRLEDESTTTLALRWRSTRPAEGFGLRILRGAIESDHVYLIEGLEDGKQPFFVTITDVIPGHAVPAAVTNRLETPRKVVAITPGRALEGDSEKFLEIREEDPSGDVISVVFKGSGSMRDGIIPGSSECEGTELLRLELEPAPSVPFRRADANADGRSDIADAIAILTFLFQRGPELPCEAAADVDVGGTLNVTDPVRILLALFGGGPPIPAPFPDCGPRSVEDTLGCPSFGGC